MPWEKQFDVDVALEKAGETFWAHGYEATSMTDLLRAMGIQKGSFYDTYGCKRDVYLRALEQYVASRFRQFEALAEGEAPLDALNLLMKVVLDECLGPDSDRGCMVVNGALEFGHEDEDVQHIVHGAFKTHERILAKHIVAGQESGDISAEVDAAAAAKGMLAVVMGMRVYSRSGAPKSTLKTLHQQALALVER